MNCGEYNGKHFMSNRKEHVMTNYICINGKKAELTEEQMKALGIELPKASPFERKSGQIYYAIIGTGNVETHTDYESIFDKGRYNVANYCTDKSLMEQRALHEILNRLLWRYTMMHNGDKLNFQDCCEIKYYILYNCENEEFEVCEDYSYKTVGEIYFCTEEIAENAIEEIIKPFIEAHPEFEL